MSLLKQTLRQCFGESVSVWVASNNFFFSFVKLLRIQFLNFINKLFHIFATVEWINLFINLTGPIRIDVGCGNMSET